MPTFIRKKNISKTVILFTFGVFPYCIVWTHVWLTVFGNYTKVSMTITILLFIIQLVLAIIAINRLRRVYENRIPESATDSDINNACMCVRHDFPLLDEEEKNKLRLEALHWFDAWQKTISDK